MAHLSRTEDKEMLSAPIFVILNELGKPLRIRDSGSVCDDPVVCFESDEGAREWMKIANVEQNVFEVLAVPARPHEVVAEIIGISSDKVTFMMMKPRDSSETARHTLSVAKNLAHSVRRIAGRIVR
ncbi:MAG: hypothetical protein HY936_06635 [Nitrosomonadales bacterium]|nr:hypothetical protein [Nitrosomonadales bacterium]